MGQESKTWMFYNRISKMGGSYGFLIPKQTLNVMEDWEGKHFEITVKEMLPTLKQEEEKEE